MNRPNTAKRGRPTNESARAKRPARVPMSGQRMRMHIDESDKDPAFHYAWINDQRGLLQRAKKAGYEHVTTEEMPVWGETSIDSSGSESSLVSMVVGEKIVAYLMKQPMEYYQEDQDEMQRLIDTREADMKRELNSGEDGRYGEVKIS